MKFHLTIIFLLFTTFLFAQINLVPNPSFEDYSNCPYIGEINYATGWYSGSGDSTPELFNSCASTVPSNSSGYQNTPDNNCKGYAGEYIYTAGVTRNREFIKAQLLSPLNIGIKYYCSLKVNLCDVSNCATNNMGMLFSTIPINLTDPAPLNNFAQVFASSIISDKINWTTIFGSFIADSAYSLIYLGNFFDDLHTDTAMVTGGGYQSAYYLIDDVCISTDSTFCYDYSYSCGDGLFDYLKNNIQIFPNPATNELTLDFTLTDKCSLELYNLIGAKRKAITLDSGSQTRRIDLTDIDNGLYFYSVVDRNGNRIKTGKLIIIK